MKKVLSLMLLMLLGALGSQVSARWQLGDQKGASEIAAGDTIVLEYRCNTSLLGRYLTGHKLGPVGIVADENIYAVEDGPLDIRTGAKTIVLKQVATGGYLSFNGSWGTLTYPLAPTDSCYVQVISCGDDIPWSNTYAWDQYQSGQFRPNAVDTTTEVANWRKPGDGKLANDKSVAFSHSYLNSEDELTWAYLGTWGNADNIWFWQYTDANQWNVYDVDYILDLKGDLESLVEEYTAEGEYMGGTDPGFYQQKAADAYSEALVAAFNAMVGDYSDDELREVIANLKSAHAAVVDACIPITEGYYYMVSAFEDYINNFNVEKAAYANTQKMQLYYKNFDATSGEFVFQLTPGEGDNEWWVKHYLSDTYVGKPGNWYASTPPITTDKEEVQNIRLRATGKWFWGSKSQHSTSYTPTTGSASDSEGALTSWGQWGDEGTYTTHFNLWYLRKITDTALLEQFAQDKAQAALNMTLKGLIADANDLYTNLFCYASDTSNPLITQAEGNGKLGEGNQIEFQQVRTQNVSYSDNYKFLIDNVDTTYMQGKGYVTFDISQTPQKILTLEYNTRCANSGDRFPNQHEWGRLERPNTVVFYASNDTTAEAEWKEVGTVKMADLPLPARATVDLGGEYSFVRAEMIDNAKGESYFTVSEFQLYKAIVDESTSQYHTTAGLAANADYMKGLLPAMSEAVNAGTATQGQIDTLTAAIAAVKEMYADTTELSALIQECQTLVDNVQVGEGMGQLSSQSLADALQQAIADARATAFQSPMSVEAVLTATTNVNAARDAFMAGLKSVEEGKWYFITNLDTERTGETGADDAQCYGNAIYLNSNNSHGSIVKWGYYDSASNTLNADSDPKAMWRFVKIDSTSFYAIQNLYTGYYLGDYAGDNINLPVSETPVPYEVAYSGNARFTLYPRGGDNKKDFSLWPEGAANDVVCHETGSSASGWTFQEIDPEAQEAISISDFNMNLIDVMTLPYNVSNLSDMDENVHTYAVKKISQETNNDGELVTTVELYEKQEIAAGEPCIIILGSTDAEVEREAYDLIIPFPTEIVDHTYSCKANGLFGALHSAKAAAGTAISNCKEFYAVGADGSTFTAQTGVIDLSTYTGEVEGVQTAYTLTITGLSSLRPEGDTNGDGIVNTADIAAIYSYVQFGEESGYALSDLDVNGDGNVDSNDVVSIYEKIASTGATSRQVLKSLLKQLAK